MHRLLLRSAYGHHHLLPQYQTGTSHLQNKFPPNRRYISTRLYSITTQKTVFFFYKIYLFQIRALRNINAFVANQQIHTVKIYYITYYISPTRFGHNSDLHQDATRWKSIFVKLKLAEREYGDRNKQNGAAGYVASTCCVALDVSKQICERPTRCTILLINLFQLHFPVQVSNKQFIISRLFLYTQHTAYLMHVLRCLAADMLWLELSSNHNILVRNT